MSDQFIIAGLNGCLNEVTCCLSQECFCFLILVIADSSLLKSVLECSRLMASNWKDQHPSDTEDEVAVGLSSEDECRGSGS